MKFEKFLKHCGARGSVVETIEGKFLKFAESFFKIPEGVNVLSAVTIPEPDYLVYIFDDFREGDLCKAELTGAELPTPDASPSSLHRIFSNEYGGSIPIPNKLFGFIEKSDHVYTFVENADTEGLENTQQALVITSGYGDEEYICGVILERNFYFDTITESENK